MFRGFLNIAPSIDYLERAFDAAKYGWYSPEPYIDGTIQSTIDPDMAPRARHVLLRPIPRTSSARATGTPSANGWATRCRPRWSATSPASAISSCSARWSRRSTSSARSASARATSSPASCWRRRCSSCAPRGLVAVPNADRRLLPVRLRHPSGRLRDGRPGSSGRGADPEGRGLEARLIARRPVDNSAASALHGGKVPV